jgi:hypothetical protein
MYVLLSLTQVTDSLTNLGSPGAELQKLDSEKLRMQRRPQRYASLLRSNVS